MIASPPQLQMSPVAMIVSPTHSVRCNYREPDMPMIASPGADDCKPLQVTRHNIPVDDADLARSNGGAMII